MKEISDNHAEYQSANMRMHLVSDGEEKGIKKKKIATLISRRKDWFQRIHLPL